jgi:hypothetical protein
VHHVDLIGIVLDCMSIDLTQLRHRDDYSRYSDRTRRHEFSVGMNVPPTDENPCCGLLCLLKVVQSISSQLKRGNKV